MEVGHCVIFLPLNPFGKRTHYSIIPYSSIAVKLKLTCLF
jgi:hypothetical protein